MSRIFWDTNIFIYFFEDHGRQGKVARKLRENMLERRDLLITSAMTVGEILVKPRERQDSRLCQQYEEAITATALVVPFDLSAARRFSALRLDRSLRPPDAIQLACAGAAGIDLFVTNDNRLSNLRVDGIQFIVSLDRVPF
jgi:predicted nucleic acid-binding protein